VYIEVNDMPDPEPPAPTNVVDSFETGAKKFADDLIDQIKKAFDDIQSLVIITAAASTDAQLDFNIKKGDWDTEKLKAKVSAMCSTNIRITGDISYMIPAETNDPRIRQEVIALHKENIAVAIANSRKLLNTVLTMVDVAAEIAGRPIDISDRLMDIQNHSVVTPPVPDVTTPPVPDVTTSPQLTQ
jgi:hypothetical protein